MRHLLLLSVLMFSAAAAGSSLQVDWLWHPAGRPIEVVVQAPAEAAELELVLLDAEGIEYGRASIQVGRSRLDEHLPELSSLPAAGWLQLIVDGTPEGTPLVVQPVYSRQIPQTEDALSPSGRTYTKIVGWLDENAEEDIAHPLFCGFRIYPDADLAIETDHGTMRFLMRPDHAPNTVWNFRELSRGGFYRDIPFHRIVPLTGDGDPFVIQAGDPTPTGSGGPGYWLPLESSTLPHELGVISMARAMDPDSAGSQFFICLSREGTARLDGSYCSFGQLVEGADVVKAIAAVELADVEAGRPAVPPRIQGVRLIPAPPRSPGKGRLDADVSPEESGIDNPERVSR